MIKLNENTQQYYNVNSIKDLEEIAKSMFNLIKKNNYDFKDLIHYFEKDNNFDYKFRTKIWNDLNVYEMPKTCDNILNVLTAIVKANDKEITNETSDLNMSDLNNDLNQGKLQQVQAGEVIKLQKPQQDTYTDIITNNDGVEIGTCSVCGATDVIIADHICKTVVQPFESIKNKYGTTANKMLTKIEWFKNVVLEKILKESTIYDIEYRDEEGDNYTINDISTLEEAKAELKRLQAEEYKIIQTWVYVDNIYKGPIKY